jgi:hypothetical protein
LQGKDVADSKIADIIKAAVIKGTLSELIVQPISYINAISIAEEIGLRVLVNLSEKTEVASGYKNLISIDLEIEGVFFFVFF